LFVFRSKTVSWDFVSMVQVVQDQMQQHAWIIDDSIMNLCPVPPLNSPVVSYSKNNPGVRITVLKFKTERKNF